MKAKLCEEDAKSYKKRSNCNRAYKKTTSSLIASFKWKFKEHEQLKISQLNLKLRHFRTLNNQKL